MDVGGGGGGGGGGGALCLEALCASIVAIVAKQPIISIRASSG